MSLSLVVLAAGMGSRYGGLKQVDGFGPGGETILEYSLYDAKRAGFDHFVFVIRSDIEEVFTKYVLEKLPSDYSYSIAYQDIDTYVPNQVFVENRTKPRGTGHALLAAKNYLTGPFAVINADDYYGVDAYRQIVKFLLNTCKEKVFGMVGYHLINTLSSYGTVNRGVCVVENGFLKSVQERLKIERSATGKIFDNENVHLDDETIVSMNFRGFNPAFLDALEKERSKFLETYIVEDQREFFLPSVCDTLIQHNGRQCEVLVSDDQRCGVTYQEDRPYVKTTLTALVKKLVYPATLREDHT